MDRVRSRRRTSQLDGDVRRDIELWPPDSQPVIGRGAVSAQMTLGTTRIQRIEITDRRIRGSNEIAYLTATYRPRFLRRKAPLLNKSLEAICEYYENRVPIESNRCAGAI